LIAHLIAPLIYLLLTIRMPGRILYHQQNENGLSLH
jgi:hypothetical protein